MKREREILCLISYFDLKKIKISEFVNHTDLISWKTEKNRINLIQILYFLMRNYNEGNNEQFWRFR